MTVTKRSHGDDRDHTCRKDQHPVQLQEVKVNVMMGCVLQRIGFKAWKWLLLKAVIEAQGESSPELF